MPTCFSHQSNDKSKVVLREFSRRCRLPDNLFKFDETGVSVSFINNIWVRIEIPIIEFIDFSANIMLNTNATNAANGNGVGLSGNIGNSPAANMSHYAMSSNGAQSTPSGMISGGSGSKKNKSSSDKYHYNNNNKNNERENDFRLRKTSSNEFFFLNEVKI
jgi:hypothetical protein